MSQFSAKQRSRVRAAVAGERSPASLLPAERHQFVHHYAVEDGLDPLRQIARRRDTDRGTALLMYWMLQPARFVARRPAAYEQEHFELLVELSEKLSTGFYDSAEIGFDPEPWAAEDKDGALIDASMREPVPGQPFGPQDLEPSYLREITPEERVAVGKSLSGGIALLEKSGIEFPVEKPQRSVGAIASFLGRAQTDSVRVRGVASLGWPWSDALRRSGGWDWAAWCDVDTEESSIVLLSADRSMIVIGQNLVTRIAAGTLEARVLRSLFHRLHLTTEASELRDEIGRGLVTSAASIPFREK